MIRTAKLCPKRGIVYRKRKFAKVSPMRLRKSAYLPIGHHNSILQNIFSKRYLLTPLNVTQLTLQKTTLRCFKKILNQKLLLRRLFLSYNPLFCTWEHGS